MYACLAQKKNRGKSMNEQIQPYFIMLNERMSLRGKSKPVFTTVQHV